MSTLSKFQQLRASSKTTKKNSIIICLEITPGKIQKPWPNLIKYIYIYIYTHTYTYIYIHIYTYTYTHIYIYTCIYIHTTHTHTHLYIYIHIYIHIIYIHIDIYIHTYTHIHTHTHIHKKKKNAQSQPQIHGRLVQKSAETVLPKENSPPRNQLKSSQFTYRKESSQPISKSNHLTSIWHISRQNEFCFAVSEQALEDNRGINR